MLYLGEGNDSQRDDWRKTLDVHSTDSDTTSQIALFPHDRPAPTDDVRVVQIRLDQPSLQRPRQWGGCWLARTALADLLGEDFGLAKIHKLYPTLDQVLPLKEKLFDHLRDQWRDLFGAKYEVLLYDLTSTCFETDTPEDPQDPRRHGYSRDHRPDCLQVVIALVVTPEAFPLSWCDRSWRGCANKTGMMRVTLLFYLRGGVAEAHSAFTSAEDRALRGLEPERRLKPDQRQAGLRLWRGPAGSAGVSFNALNPSSSSILAAMKNFNSPTASLLH